MRTNISTICLRRKRLIVFLLAVTAIAPFLISHHYGFNWLGKQSDTKHVKPVNDKNELKSEKSPNKVSNDDADDDDEEEDEDDTSKEVHHLFFQQVHQTASLDVLNVVHRFVIKRRLVAQLPKRRKADVWPEQNWLWAEGAEPLPAGAKHFDVVCDPLAFDEKSVRKRLHPDTVFVGIVRQPLDQFLTAFWYYREKQRLKYLLRVPGDKPVSTYLQNPDLWEPDPDQEQFTNNRMSMDFGMDPRKVRDKAYIKDYLKYLNRTFHLVIVTDRFDESLILMRRLLGWKVQDIMYVQSHEQEKLHNAELTSKEKQAHEDYNVADYALYEHFSQVLDNKIRAEGDSFTEELESFRFLRQAIAMYCLSSDSEGGSRKQPMIMQATYWREEFQVSRDMCNVMRMDEAKLVEEVRDAASGKRKGNWRHMQSSDLKR